MRCFAVVLVAVLALPGCAVFREAGHGPADYYPLKKGSVWTYKITSFEREPAGESSIITTRVVEEKDGVVELMQGSKSYSYVIDNKGLMKTKSRSYILRHPVEKGVEWQVEVGGIKGSARVLDTPAAMTVLDQSYESCALVEESYPQLARLVSTYCPAAGLVKMEEYSFLGGKEVLLTRVELMAYRPGGK